MLDEVFAQRLCSPHFHFEFKGADTCEVRTGMPEILVMPTYTGLGCEEATQTLLSMADLKSPSSIPHQI